MRYFTRLHPLVAVLYFISVVLITAFNQNPIVSGLSLFFSLTFGFYINGKKSGLISLFGFFPFVAVFSVLNAAFSKSGETVLFTALNKNITLESLLFGVNSAATVYAILIWCGALSKVLTSEKTVYLFGNIAPKTSLVLSMTFGFVPKAIKRYGEISDAQKGIGVYSQKGFKMLKAKLNAVFSLIATELENSVTVADSMRARGYGIKNRTTAIVKRFSVESGILGSIFIALGCVAGVLSLSKSGNFSFYPIISSISFSSVEILYYSVCAILLAFPTFLEIKDDLKWNYLKSKI